ncbi:hypothetical protein GE09DRAFT_1159663 [Coniochaeta sp. 2T2.1]|nr:hypothetical protein GE09DRAFT_1159663 [Coniochaeta sp. 2T2.1]
MRWNPQSFSTTSHDTHYPLFRSWPSPPSGVPFRGFSFFTHNTLCPPFPTSPLLLSFNFSVSLQSPHHTARTMSSAPGPPLDMASPVDEPRLSFWDLPRELRDMIYEEYAAVDGGHIFNPDSGKLRSAKPHAHPLALQRTCKRAALEMTGLALSLNTVTFSTGATMREAAFRFDFMLKGLGSQLRDTVGRDLQLANGACVTHPFGTLRGHDLGTV